MIQKSTSQPSPVVNALTGSNSTDSLYQRDSAVEKQIQNALILTDETIIKNARISDKQDERYLQEEALVYLIQMSKQEENEVLYSALSEILLGRIEYQVKYHLRSIEKDLKEDAYSKFLARLFQQILRTDGKGDFLQVKFWLAMNRLATTVFRRFKSREQREKRLLDAGQFSSIENSLDEDDNDDPEFIEPERFIPGENRWSLVEQWSLIVEAMQNLDEKIRKAYFLRHFLGWQIETTDPNESSLSEHFEKTPKTIRNWLHLADTTLEQKWRGDHNE